MSRLIHRLATTAALSVGLTLLVASDNEARAQGDNGGSVAEGARVYGSMCGRCHNPRSPLERTDRSWVTIANHMRARGNLTGTEVRQVLAFLQATNTDPRERVPLPGGAAAAREPIATGPVATDTDVISRGKALTEERACLGCHVIEKGGGQVGPTLNGLVARKGADFVRRKMADPTFDNTSSMMPNFGLASQEIEAIVAYLNTLRRE
jgi:mono/diheme cytochrome c family protein